MKTNRYTGRANSQPIRGSVARRKSKKEASLIFCWCFGGVVCLTFGLAAFLMFSAFSTGGSGVSDLPAAWGENGSNENFVTSNLVQVKITELDNLSALQTSSLNSGDEIGELYANADYSEKLEDFGPFPKYLSDYQSIVLNVDNDGTRLPDDAYDDDDDEAEEHENVSVANAKAESDSIVKNSVAEKPAPKIVLSENSGLWHEHVVKTGETLSDIARAYGGITAQDILRANGLKDANRLSENQILLIPNDASKIADTLDEVRTRQMRVAAVNEKVEPLKVSAYVVAQGDSLWSISNTQNIELDTLIGSNTFKSSAKLRPGAVLRIPNQDGIFYKLKKGETIESVAKRYRVKLAKVKLVNSEVDMKALKEGDEIFLPGAKPEGLIEVAKIDVKKVPIPSSSTSSSSGKKSSAKAQPVVAESNLDGKKTARYSWPVMGRINSPFGWRQHPITKRKDFHTGIDIKSDRNTPIKGAGSGRVVYSGWMGGYGKVIVIEHNNGQSTLYAHCSSLLVGKGASVSSGQIVAKVGTTGRSTGPHLHFEVRNGNSPVNPIKYLR